MANDKKQPGPTRVFENAQVMFKNFRGLGPPTFKFNAPGERNFNLVIPTPELVDQMVAEGWNVKCLKPYEDQDEPKCIVKVKVKFTYRPPKIVMLTSRGRTELTEDTVGSLDLATFTNLDLIIQGSYYDINDRQGMTAYLQSAYVTVYEDPLELKYAMTPEDLDDDPPFDVDPTH